MLIFKRFLAGYIDLMIVSILILFPLAAAFGLEFMNDNLMLIATSGLVFYTLKDMCGTSVGKRLLKLRLVEGNNKKPPILKRILRNLTMIIYPIEALIIIVRKDHRKLMDLVFDTNVIES